MKVLKLLIAILLVTSFSFSAYGQRAERNFDKREFKERHAGLNLPDLTEEQTEQIKALRTSMKKEMIKTQNEVGELNAKLRTLETADKPNMNKINSTIDQISVIKTDMAKKKAAHQQDIRSILTQEQRVVFDSRPHGERKGKKQNRGHHNRNRNW